jgi:hypothetical protein
MAANAAVNIRALLAQFPNVIIGDIEPFPVSVPNWLTQYQAGIEAFGKALGLPLAFFDADVEWDTPSYLTDLTSVRKMVGSEGIPFGIIYSGNPYDTSDAPWIQSATQHMLAVELNLGSPDLVIFQSWQPYPKKLLPETDSDSFTSLIDTYFRRRTTLSSSVSGSTLQGALTAADTGQPITNALINVMISPTAGSGVPALYSVAGTLPAGTQSVVFGARVNLECNCSGTADFLVSSFTMDAGVAGTITGDFSNQLNGWDVSAAGSPAGTAKIEGASLHVSAQPGQSVCAQLHADTLYFRCSVYFSRKCAGLSEILRQRIFHFDLSGGIDGNVPSTDSPCCCHATDRQRHHRRPWPLLAYAARNRLGSIPGPGSLRWQQRHLARPKHSDLDEPAKCEYWGHR